MSRRLALLALAGTLLLLLAHALFYRFLCDDAFISFRYARNLAAGHGLVFNPGHERVEGYTNFLWVLVLAALDVVGVRPERAAPALGLLLTGALWGLTARAAWRMIVPTWPYALFPLVALALTRSVAVWSTSGLETRLFEVLVVAGVLRLVEEAEQDGARSRPWAAVLFGLASLTRPDGILIAASAMGAAAACRLARTRRFAWREWLLSAAAFGAIVGGHLLFRVLYYGAWLPNTYYAKVGGQSWWGMGAAYLAAFALEYGAVLWLPMLAVGTRAFVREGRGALAAIFGAAVIPHAVYVASIGGDHFEYRPLDLYFPFAFLVMGRGLAWLVGRARGRAAAGAYALLILVGLVALPWASHAQFPREYRAGYPGRAASIADREGFLDPVRSPIYRWPVTRAIARAHRRLLDRTTASLVGVRQEEHAMFLDGVVPQGDALRGLVERGLLPRDTHIAICAVGAIPYLSGLRTLDRLGLTDAVVAHQAPAALRVMAHERYATFGYATEAGADLWSAHPYFLVLRLDDDALLWHVDVARADGDEPFVADVSEDEAIVALLPGGAEAARTRFPNLGLRSLSDPAARAALLDRVVASSRRRLAREPGARSARVALAMALRGRGEEAEALAAFRELAVLDDPVGWYNVGTILAEQGDLEGAIEALRRAVALDPGMVPAHHNLGMALAKTGQFAPALQELREAVGLAPESPGAIFALGAVALGAGDRAESRMCRERLEALGTPVARNLAQRLAEALGDPPGRE